jgi:hypothetical protein
MARELRKALLERGLDPADPPDGGPPSEAAFRVYRKHGGKQHTDPDEMVAALVERVASG